MESNKEYYKQYYIDNKEYITHTEFLSLSWIKA